MCFCSFHLVIHNKCSDFVMPPVIYNRNFNFRCLAGLVSKYIPIDFEGKKRRITSIDYRPDGQEILVSYSSDYIYIFDPKVSK